MKDLTVVGFLWQGTDLPSYSGGVYDLRYVENLARGVKRCLPGGRLVMMVDEFYGQQLIEAGMVPDQVELVEFKGYGVGGWSNVLEAFNPDLYFAPRGDSRVLLVGLDTILIDDISWLFEWNYEDVGLPRDPYHRQMPCDAVVSFNQAGGDLVWRYFLEQRPIRMKNHLYANGSPSEMVLLRDLSKKCGWRCIDDTHPGQLLSYKCHVKRPLRDHPWQDSSVVYFHGNPKPADLDVNDPIYKIWESA